MKISLNWIKEFTDINLSNEELLERINSRLGAIEEIVDFSERFENITVVDVVSCEPHPDADKLNVCMIDDGGRISDVERNEDGLVQVVCGAPNVKAGIKAAWVPPGSTVPSTFADLEPLTLDARELRGVTSNGMLGSGREVLINDDHEGILIIDDETAEVGDDFAEIFKLNDLVIDIENKMFTHRPDCFGVLGVARELAGIQDVEFTSPDWYKQTEQQFNSDNKLAVELDNQLPDEVNRFTLLAFDNVKIAPSPLQMQSYLNRVGLKPINNVVDITNFIAHLTAQPLHAFDYDKVAELSSGDGAKIVVRYPNSGESVELLDGRTINPHEKAIMICTDQTLLGVGGLMGGIGSEVDESTTKVLLEVANFNLYSIRRSSMKHGIFTEAGTRFNKGQSPDQIPAVVGYASELMQANSGAVIASDFVDDYPVKREMSPVAVTAEFINKRLGSDLLTDEIAKTLRNVEFEVEVDDDRIKVESPFWRQDIEIPEDIVEETGRLTGYDQLKITLPKRTTTPTPKDQMLSFKQNTRELLSSSGGNEVLSHSFVSKQLMEQAQQDVDVAYEIRNALSPELNYYRLTVIPSLLEKVHANHKARHDKFALFEMGKVHNKKEITDELPVEREVLGLVFSADGKSADCYQGAPYYQAKRYLQSVIDNSNLTTEFVRLDETTNLENTWIENLSRLFIPHRSAVVSIKGKQAGVIGEFTHSLASALKLPEFCAGFEVDLRILSENASASNYIPSSKYPITEQDVTYEVTNSVKFADISQAISVVEVGDDMTINASPTDAFIPESGDVRRLTWRLNLQHEGRTLTNEDVKSVLELLDKALAEQFSATRI